MSRGSALYTAPKVFYSQLARTSRTSSSYCQSRLKIAAADSWRLHLQASLKPDVHSCCSSETHLLVIRAQHDPAAESVAQVNHAGAAAEAQDFGKGDSHGQD